MSDWYSSDEKIAYYVERSRQGLRSWEQCVVWQHMATPGTVLVVGCGAGREAFALEQLGWRVTGVDVTPRMLDAARARPSGVTFLLTDGSLDDIDVEPVDAATLWSQVLRDVPSAADRLRFLRNVHRLVRPGGTISLSVHDKALTLAEVGADRVVSVDVPEPGDVVLLDGYNHYFTEDELRTLLDDAGFVDTEVFHTDELGEAWGNVFVAVSRRPR